MALKRQDFYRENKDYEVTVFVLTYNLKDYIREALDSILMQKVNFNYQILVADDCSTDGTFEILEEYAQKYDFIHIERSKVNSKSQSYAWTVRNRVDTKYIAMLDGDDYWIDDQKLQEQFDILEKNPDYVVVYDSLYQHTTDDPRILPERMSDEVYWGGTCAMFFRNIIDLSLYHDVIQKDGSIFLLFSIYGKLAYRSKITNFYRYNPTGLHACLPADIKAEFIFDWNIINLGFCLKENLRNNFTHKFLHGNNLKWLYKNLKHANSEAFAQRFAHDKILSMYIEEYKSHIDEIFCTRIDEVEQELKELKELKDNK